MKIKYFIIGALIFIIAVLLGIGNTPITESFLSSKDTDIEFLNSQTPLASLLPDSKEFVSKKVSLLVEKSKNKLTFFYDLKPFKSFPITIGKNPKGDKQKEGDGKTPEGNFKVKSLYKHNQWNKFIWLNFPTIDSWKKFAQSKAKGEIKLSESIGGKIGIHGVTDDSLIDQKVNWTDGSISMKNADIDEIFSFIKPGVLVQISE